MIITKILFLILSMTHFTLSKMLLPAPIFFHNERYKGMGRSSGLARGLQVKIEGMDLTQEGMGLGNIAIRSQGYTYFSRDGQAVWLDSNRMVQHYVIDTIHLAGRGGTASALITTYVSYSVTYPWIRNCLLKYVGGENKSIVYVGRAFPSNLIWPGPQQQISPAATRLSLKMNRIREQSYEEKSRTSLSLLPGQRPGNQAIPATRRCLPGEPATIMMTRGCPGEKRWRRSKQPWRGLKRLLKQIVHRDETRNGQA